MSLLKTILFLVVVYFIIRFVSNMFLPSGKKKKSNVRFFYRTVKNVRNQQKKQQQQQRQRDKKPEEHLDEIEEAEYEDVTEDDENDG